MESRAYRSYQYGTFDLDTFLNDYSAEFSYCSPVFPIVVSPVVIGLLILGRGVGLGRGDDSEGFEITKKLLVKNLVTESFCKAMNHFAAAAADKFYGGFNLSELKNFVAERCFKYAAKLGEEAYCNMLSWYNISSIKQVEPNIRQEVEEAMKAVKQLCAAGKLYSNEVKNLLAHPAVAKLFDAGKIGEKAACAAACEINKTLSREVPQYVCEYLCRCFGDAVSIADVKADILSVFPEIKLSEKQRGDVEKRLLMLEEKNILGGGVESKHVISVFFKRKDFDVIKGLLTLACRAYTTRTKGVSKDCRKGEFQRNQENKAFANYLWKENPKVSSFVDEAIAEGNKVFGIYIPNDVRAEIYNRISGCENMKLLEFLEPIIYKDPRMDPEIPFDIDVLNKYIQRCNSKCNTELNHALKAEKAEASEKNSSCKNE